jgi:hypothetical protein
MRAEKLPGQIRNEFAKYEGKTGSAPECEEREAKTSKRAPFEAVALAGVILILVPGNGAKLFTSY